MEVIKKYFSDFTAEQIGQLEKLKEIYEEWNQKINVISRKDMDHFYLHHVLHSLSIAAIFDFRKGQRVMDLGTGGGFPGIPLAIFYPDVHFHLIDSIQKKLRVVEAAAAATRLQNVTVAHTRAENVGNQTFDVVVSRAVAPLKDLWQWSRPLLRKTQDKDFAGGLICLKGGDLNLEIQQSGLRPRIWELNLLFEEDYFQEKYILQVRTY